MRIKSRLVPLMTAGMLAAALSLSACGGGDDSNGNGAGTTATSSNGGNGNGENQTISVVLKDNLFEPKDITVEEGTVTFELKNEGAAIHNMHILSTEAEGKDFMSKTTIEGGATDTFTATFTESGSIKFQCDFHLPDMVGTITVE